MTKIEEVARAIHRVVHPGYRLNELREGEQSEYYKMATAAVAAMREPNEAMVKAAAETPGMKRVDSMLAIASIHGASGTVTTWDNSPLAEANRATIDAALAEHEG
jgi:hypothetical protein